MKLTRRAVLTWAGGATLLPACSPGFDLKLDPSASYDEVLDAVHLTDIELASGLSNHAPMGAEALVAAGFAERASPFVERYGLERDVVRWREAPALPASEWSAALGDYEKREEWAAAFEAELQSATPRQLLAAQWPALVANYAAIHGTLRTAHALRALGREDTPSRRRELSRGLAYWAARRGTLPGTPASSPVTGLGVAAALARVPLVPEGERVYSGNITRRLGPLQGNAEFADAVAGLDVDAAPVAEAISDLAVLACRIFVNEGKRNIALLHGVTGVLALRSFAPFLDDAQLKAGLAYAFQNVAAFHAIQGAANGLEPVGAASTSAEALLEKAAFTSSQDPEHDIKLTEAVVGEHRLTGEPELLRAAEALLFGG